MKKIYPKDWVKYHPYNNADDVDRYYCDLVNKINKVLYSYDVMSGDPIAKEGVYEEASIFIAAWFEDVISQTGIWQVFTSQCEKRYGSRLPFYKLDENYYYDEINLEDIRFILWHCFQSRVKGVKIYNPENHGLELVAEEIYNILDKEYETAPENTRLQDFFDFSYLTEYDFLEYRSKVEWFYFNCYVNIGCYELYLHSMSEKMDGYASSDLDDRSYDIMLYSHRVNTILSGRTPLLSITAPEYLKLILEAKDVDCSAPYIDIDYREESFYIVDNEKNDYFVFKDIRDERIKYKVLKESLEFNAPRLVPKDTLVTSFLFKFGKYWLHNGAMMNYSLKEAGMKEKLKQLKRELSKVNQKQTYADFLSATKGKCFVFFKTNDEVDDFIREKMKYKNAPGVSIPDLGNDIIMLSATPERGLSILRNYCDCVASPDNPYYDKNEAEKHAINLITDTNSLPYELACLLLDLNFLKDAGLNSTKGADYGREFVRKNSQFILDYFFNSCREKDFKLYI